MRNPFYIHTFLNVIYFYFSTEVLYGDYKDIPIEKKHKKSREHRHPHSDNDVNVKSYEEILREKALRKMMEAKRQKEQFEDDFDEIIGEKPKNKKSDENKDSKIPKKDRKESLDLDSVVFDKADALDIGVGDDEIDEFNEQKVDKKQSTKEKETLKEKERNNSSEKENIDSSKNENKENPNDNVEGEEELDYNDDYVAPETEGVLLIPDETTDLTFSVDETDDLALELNQTPEEGKKEKRKPSKHSKKVSSSKSSSQDDRSSRNRHSDKKSSRQKRNIMIIDKDSPNSKKSKDNSDKSIDTAAPKKVVLVNREKAKSEEGAVVETVVIDKQLPVKVKTFEEIMEEKRKRKLIQQDVVVLSDSENSLESPDKKAKKPQSEIISIKTEDVPKPKTAAMLRKERLQLAKQEYEKRRKSMQIYQVKGPSSKGFLLHFSQELIKSFHLYSFLLKLINISAQIFSSKVGIL